MQAAALFAFGHAKGAVVAVVAMVSNSVDAATKPFDTGGHSYRSQIVAGVVTAGQKFLSRMS
jgi:hypothetical protein